MVTADRKAAGESSRERRSRRTIRRRDGATLSPHRDGRIFCVANVWFYVEGSCMHSGRGL